MLVYLRNWIVSHDAYEPFDAPWRAAVSCFGPARRPIRIPRPALVEDLTLRLFINESLGSARPACGRKDGPDGLPLHESRRNGFAEFLQRIRICFALPQDDTSHKGQV